MRKDQVRGSNGNFGTMPTSARPGSRMAEDDRLIDRIEFRVTTHDSRRLGILFHHHRTEFGWQLPTDMYRELQMASLAEYEDRAKNPTPQMIALRRRHDELERMQAQALRHVDFEQETEQVDQAIDVTMRAGDLGAVRKMLADYKNETKLMADQAIKARREMEFDKRWARLFESLNRGASLTQFEED